MLSKIICGDSISVIGDLPTPVLLWADPPDNLGMKYEGFDDNNPSYDIWLMQLVVAMLRSRSPVVWISFNVNYLPVMAFVTGKLEYKQRMFIWHYTFGQNQRNDFTPSFRPIFRFILDSFPTYPENVTVPSARQTKYNDKRANPAGKMDDDVWHYPRVTGNSRERRAWTPTQHPKELLRRIVKFSTKPGDLVIDMFAGSGNMLEVCKELDRKCIGIDISPQVCYHIAESTGADFEKR